MRWKSNWFVLFVVTGSPPTSYHDRPANLARLIGDVNWYAVRCAGTQTSTRPNPGWCSGLPDSLEENLLNLRFLTGNRLAMRCPSIPLTGPLTLDKVSPGQRAVLHDLSRLDPAQQAHLRSYGLSPGRELRVLQHAPETVVQVEFTELAFEKEIARKIWVIIQ